MGEQVTTEWSNYIHPGRKVAKRTFTRRKTRDMTVTAHRVAKLMPLLLPRILAFRLIRGKLIQSRRDLMKVSSTL